MAGMVDTDTTATTQHTAAVPNTDLMIDLGTARLTTINLLVETGPGALTALMS